MFNVEVKVELIGQFVAEFFITISVNLCRQSKFSNQCSKIACETVLASLLGMVVTTAYFVKASVMHNKNFDFCPIQSLVQKDLHVYM